MLLDRFDALTAREREVLAHVVRGQLNTIVNATEMAAFDITSRLQSIDETITRMSQFVDSSTHETNDLVAAAGQRIEQNRQLIERLDSYIAQRVNESEADQQRIATVVGEARSLPQWLTREIPLTLRRLAVPLLISTLLLRWANAVR